MKSKIISLFLILFVLVFAANVSAFNGKDGAWSLFFPGLGQFMQGRTGAGLTYVGLGLVTLGGGVYTRMSALDEYSASIEERSPQRYGDYLFFKNISDYCLLGYSITVLSSFINASFFDENTRVSIENKKEDSRISISKKF